MADARPKLSIVIPTYRRAGLLRRAVESALAQRGCDDFEVVVVDDCSRDGTREYLSGLDDPRLRALGNDANLGMGPNWNRAVRESRGRYVFVLQDDDVATPRLAARVCELFDSHAGVELLCFTTCLIGEDEREQRVFWQPEREEVLEPPRALLYFADNWTLSSTQVVFSREVFDRLGAFDLTPPIMSDAEAILRWMIDATALVVPEALALRRYWPGSVTSATQHSPEMAETMKFLAERVSSLAAESGRLDAAQLRRLRRSLARTFVEPYAFPARAAVGAQRSRVGRLISRLRSALAP